MKKKIGTRILVIVVALSLTLSALMLNDDVRAATWGRLVNWWQNQFTLYFHGDDTSADFRDTFWQPTYVPDGIPIIFYQHNYDPETGASSHIMYSASEAISPENPFIIFSASYMHWFDDDTIWSGRAMPTYDVYHTVIENNGIEYHLFISQSEPAPDGLGGFPISIFWEYRGFEFQILGNIDRDSLVEMALSVNLATSSNLPY
ncbi:MAG: DUF4367 domain-containing protein [Defluviitaleaceae bacterium]|nr:DUF4367 domain-containing protein [Defluviitaleaceae bacterium]MCL2263163.1 DUF4367 domain-containing protein [Defluviitaleaceae bacterium]